MKLIMISNSQKLKTHRIIRYALLEPDIIIELETYRYGRVKIGELFKIGSKSCLVNCRRKSEARFVAVADRSEKDYSRMITVRVL